MELGSTLSFGVRCAPGAYLRITVDPMLQIDPMGPGEWSRVRKLRLQALLDAPDSFDNTYAQEVHLKEAFWRGRLVAGTTWIAHRDGQELGMVTGAPYQGRPDAAGLFGMWVDPGSRGAHVGSNLVSTAIEWARNGGCNRLLLAVGVLNHPAQALYERYGFVRTGVVGTLPEPRTHIQELEMELVLV